MKRFTTLFLAMLLVAAFALTGCSKKVTAPEDFAFSLQYGPDFDHMVTFDTYFNTLDAYDASGNAVYCTINVSQDDLNKIYAKVVDDKITEEWEGVTYEEHDEVPTYYFFNVTMNGTQYSVQVSSSVGLVKNNDRASKAYDFFKYLQNYIESSEAYKNLTTSNNIG